MGDNKPSAAAAAKQRGVGLIEILVTVLILGIGLLGVAGLQLKSMQYNHSAYLRSQASFLAYDMIDRMRANRDKALSTNEYKLNFSDTKPSATDCYKSDADCSASQLVAFDQAEWLTRVADALPSGDGEINYVTNGTVRIYTVGIQWRDSRVADDDDATQTFYYRAEL